MVMTPEQIDAWCKRLAEAWKKEGGHQRLGQLIVNAFQFQLKERGALIMGDPFFIKDEALITAIEKMVSDGNNN
jgi:hypothetical protein